VSYLIGVLIFVVAILVSIMLHEFGHFATAKAFKMKATQFFVGFGNTLWSVRRGETEYGVKSLPVGGFVKIVGMTSMDEVDPADEPRSFRSKPGWQRVIVLSAGSFMHFMIALVLLWVLAVGIGTPDAKSTVVTVATCVPSGPTAKCASGDPASPAAKAGIKSGDRIVAVAGQPVHSYQGLISAIRKQPAGVPVTFTLVRAGRQLNVAAELARPTWDVHNKQRASFLGITQTPVYDRAGPIAAIGQAGSGFGSVVSQSVAGLSKVPCAIPVLFSKNRGTSSCGQLSSVVGVANVTGQVVSEGYTWQQTTSVIFQIVISVNIFVGIFNLLPLLPLDGGHIAIVLYERLRAAVARLRRRPDPGLVDISRLIPVSVGVFALLVGLSLLLIAADIFNPLTLSQ
jgi:membrane-associated protease RseP (regulator of RpoE activity)